MAICKHCAKEIYGDGIYAIQDDIFCEDCAMLLQRRPDSPDGFGCNGPYIKDEQNR